MSEENTIQLDDLVNPESEELEAEETEEVIEEEPEQDSQEETEEAEESESNEEDPEDEAEEPEQEDEQEKIDRIVSRRVAQEKIKLEQAQLENQALQTRLQEFEAHQQAEAERQKQLQEKLNSDDLVPDELKALANPREVPQQQQAGIQFLDNSLNEQQLLAIGSQFRLKLTQSEPNIADSVNQVLINLIKGHVVPPDVVRLANEHDNGAEFISKMVQDQDTLDKVQLAKYQSGNYEEFSLKFNELANKLKVDSSKPEKKVVKKVKPTPNEPIKSAPAVNDKPDDNTVYLP